MVKKWLFHPLKRRLAKHYLWFLKKFFGLKVVAITGSTGKTTTKEMIAAVLSRKYRTVSSFANIDPVYNLPTTILKTRPWTRWLVLEMGVEYPGEMDFYLWLAKPDIGVLTNLSWTHTEFFKNIEGVSKEKNKLVRAISNRDRLVLNADDLRIRKLAKKSAVPILFYGTNKVAKIRAEKIEITTDFRTEFELKIESNSQKICLPVLGKHFVWAALAAASIGHLEGLNLEEIKGGLENFMPQAHRLIPIWARSGALLLDDTYNSNPLAAKAALETLALAGKGKETVAVLGEMRELGNYEKEGHRQVGVWAAENKIDYLICLGNLTKDIARGAEKAGMAKERIVWWATLQEGENYLENFLFPKTVVLFKASRAIGLEKLVAFCQNK